MEITQYSENSGYIRKIGTKNPGLIIILLDQSGSMADHGKSKNAADAVNRVIYEIQGRCQTGEKVLDRCYIGVIGYGQSGQPVSPIIGGMISEVADYPSKENTIAGMNIPVWVEPIAENGTPMAAAFQETYNLLEGWISDHQDCFPPIVMNVSDGAPDDFNEGNAPQTKAAAEKIMTLGTDDGNVLLFNAHISGVTNHQMVQLPSSPSSLPDVFAKFLFSISSPVPNSLVKAAENVGLSPKNGARGLIFNADTETLVKLLTFGSSVV